MECHSAIQRNKQPIDAATSMNFKSIMLSGGSQAKRLHILGFYLYGILEKVKLEGPKTVQWLPESRGGGRRLTTKGYK